MKLAELQTIFADALVHPQSIATNEAWVARGEEHFTGNERLAPIEQLDIYREQFWLRHIGCLAEDFPTLVAFIGQAKFDAIVADYLAAHPPKHFQLRHLGDHLGPFLMSRGEELLADIARAEWAYVDAFDAEDAPPLDPRTVSAIAPDAWASVRIVFHPSVHLLRLAHPTHVMRDAVRAQKPVESPPRKPTHLAIYRGARDLLYTEEMDTLSFDLVERLMAGEALGPAGDAVAATSPDPGVVEANIGAWFTRWAALGWIARVVPP